jgi:hypothetical protein
MLAPGCEEKKRESKDEREKKGKKEKLRDDLVP